MEILEMNLEEIEKRFAELGEAMNAPEANLEEIEKEVGELENRKSELLNQIEERNKIAASIAAGSGVTIKTFSEEREGKKTVEEIRNSSAYVNAFASYIKSGDATECRALLTTNVEGGTVAAPDVVISAIQTAWDNEPIMAEVKKTYLKGNVKLGFEISASGAVEHTEGGAAVSEEELVLGIASLVPVAIKKWISVSDEVLDMNGEAFLSYIYAELGYQIAKKLADEIVADIVATSTTSSSTVPGQREITAAPGVATVAKAVAALSDEATNPVVIMNKQTYANFKEIQNGANYGVDVFDGLKVLFNNSLPAYDSATASECYAIVGDLGRGEQVNFPNGEAIEFKFDDKVLMTSDLVRVLGRMYAGHAVVAPYSFTKVMKPSIG